MTTAKRTISSSQRLTIIIAVILLLPFTACNKKKQTAKAETPLTYHQLNQQSDSTSITYTDSIDADTVLDQQASPKDKILPSTISKQQKRQKAALQNLADSVIIIHVGREIKAKQLESYHWKNMRLMLQDYDKIFQENDYITGEQLATFIHHKSNARNSVKKLIRWFISKNIEKIEKANNYLIIRTKNSKNINEKLHIPGLVNVQLKINDKTKIVLGKSFQSQTAPFTKRYMLPMNIDGIEIVNQDNQINLKGFVCGDLLYTNYPKTTEGIPLRLK